MKPFDYVNDINYGKKNIIKNSDNPELAEKLYPSYLVNKALSQFPDTAVSYTHLTLPTNREV